MAARAQAMRTCVLVFVIATAAVVGCNDVPEPLVIPGPTAPSRVITGQPLVWDSREELLDWVANAVTRGPISVEGDGAAAFIRVKLDFNNYVMRGPDLAPPVADVRGARVRARLRHDRPRSPQSVQTEDVHLYFEVVNPDIPTTQPSMHVSVPPGEEWLDLELKSGLYCCLRPLTVMYAYVAFRSTSPATMEIDRIELTKSKDPGHVNLPGRITWPTIQVGNYSGPLTAAQMEWVGKFSEQAGSAIDRLEEIKKKLGL
jgi:hypothetical protein